MKLGFQPMNIGLRFYGNAVHPSTGFSSSPWSMQVQIAFLFPKLSKEMEQMMLEKSSTSSRRSNSRKIECELKLKVNRELVYVWDL